MVVVTMEMVQVVKVPKIVEELLVEGGWCRGGVVEGVSS